MIAFIVRRLIAVVPILLGISLIIFVLMSVVPGDPIAGLIDPRQGTFDPKAAEELRHQWGLDRPKYEQYLLFLGNAVRGDLGRSLHQHSPVVNLVAERFPATARLALAAMLYATVVGVSMGVIAAVKRNTWADTASMVVALGGVSMPVFWLGLMLMLLFGVILQWLPVSGMGQGEPKYLVLPALTLGSVVTGIIARVTRSAMLNVIQQDYILTARAKGLAERTVMYRHALKNALIPVVTIVGVQTGNLLAGAVITETVFNWPGVGRLLVQSIFQRDLPVVQGVVLFLALMFAGVNLVVDLIYGFIDPRIRYS
jgi:ABC-type dipeptide/oligopeptide/nickel transport system permease component